MIIAVVGLGSMGKRRIRLIKEMYPSYGVIGIDARNDRRKEAYEYFSINCYDSLDKCNVIIDCVFVCTPPLSHNAIIHNALNRGCHVFTELNLVSDGYDDNIELAQKNGLKLFLSSTFLYREEIKQIRERVDAKRKWNYIYHVGQYLPDWHPWESYEDLFLSNKKTNGCREILAIELPWLIETFGEVANVDVSSDKMTQLNIDYKDNYMIQFYHKNGNKGCVVVDVVSPVAVRRFGAYCEGRYISWDGVPDSLIEFDPLLNKTITVRLTEKTEHMDGYGAFVVENAYKNEIRAFFDSVINNNEPVYGFAQDKEILNTIDLIGA